MDHSQRSTQLQFNFDTLASRIGLVGKRPLDPLLILDNNIPFHATRLLLLIYLAGRPKSNPVIDGRTKLVKLDFFVRYPEYLIKAARYSSANDKAEVVQSTLRSARTIESRMIRYRYGPWDHKYYLILAYLSGKQLITISVRERMDRYALSETGRGICAALANLPEFLPIVTRCQIAGEIFGGKSGSQIKDFIYTHFPEIVRTPQNQLISSQIEESTLDS
jgi:hypothetical protein